MAINNNPATDRQLAYLASMGVTPTRPLTVSAASRLIDTVKATIGEGPAPRAGDRSAAYGARMRAAGYGAPGSAAGAYRAALTAPNATAARVANPGADWRNRARAAGMAVAYAPAAPAPAPRYDRPGAPLDDCAWRALAAAR